MNMKRFVAAVLVLCLAVCLCACGNTQEKPATEPTKATAEATQPTDDGLVTYTVKVGDEGGNPVSGAGVQLCKESCLPGITNAEGLATFRVAEDSEYKVSFMNVPAGYEGAEEAYYFEDGAFALTITLKAVA